MGCSSRSPPQRCASSLPTPSTWEPGSGSRWCCTPGARRSPTIRTCTASCQAAAWPSMPIAGSAAGRDSSCQCACSRACSGDCFCKRSPGLTAMGSCSSSVSTPRWPDPATFAQWLAPLRTTEWVVYAKRPFAGPQAVLGYLSRYTHRVAISNRRLVAFDERGVTFRWKDYRAKGRTRYKTMTLGSAEFMRRFLLHVLPSGFHRIRHYGLLANAARKQNLAATRSLLQPPAPEPAEPTNPTGSAPPTFISPTFICQHCGAPMIVIETLPRPHHIRAPPTQLAAP